MIYKVLHSFCFLFCIGFSISLVGQDYLINHPYINNYKKSTYGGGTENWDIAASEDGQVYIANNEGLLVFSAGRWSLFRLPGHTVVRSVELDTITGRVYVGGQDEFGYFLRMATGELKYFSLRDKLSSDQKSLEDIWEIQVMKGQVYFRSVNKIFVFNGTSIRPCTDTPYTVNYFEIIRGTIYFCDPYKGLFTLEKDKTHFIPGSEIFIGERISDIIAPQEDKLLFITEKKGIFTYTNQQFAPFSKNSSLNKAILNSAIVINKDLLAIGSVLKGIFFVNGNGEILFVINKSLGLQNNGVIKLGLDANQNLWAATNNGIDKILIQSPFRIMFPDGDLQGGVYDVLIHDQKLYVGTNNGLFYTDWKDNSRDFIIGEFKPVKNSSGQVWGLDIIDGQLMMGHNEGAFLIDKDEAVKLSGPITGTWKFVGLKEKNLMLAGTYEGFHLYKKINNKWQFSHKFFGFNESARVIAQDKDFNIWVSHPYRKVYKIAFAEDFSAIKQVLEFGKEEGLPSDPGNYVAFLNDEIYVNSDKGIFRYDQEKKIFEEDKELNKITGKDDHINRFFIGTQGDLWYKSNSEFGVLMSEKMPFTPSMPKLAIPFLSDKLLGGFEKIYAPAGQYVFVCSDRGLIAIDKTKLLTKSKITFGFDRIISSNQSGQIVKQNSVLTSDPKIVMPSYQNNWEFYFQTNMLDDTDPVTVSYTLQKSGNTWAEGTEQNKVDFRNLAPGDYVLSAYAVDGNRNTSEEIKYAFTIQPAWYKSTLAYMIYLLGFVLLMYYLLKSKDKKHRVEKVKLISEIEESEAKVETLINDKLQSEIDYKNKELALSTMHIVQKNETLSKLREELDAVLHQVKDTEVRDQIRKVVGILSDDQRLEDDWESFAFHFDQVHTHFLRRLQESYSQLSPKDLKLCAYLRMNLATKEIAPLLNISVRGVEISRYRLRKKMNIDPDINLSDFMMKF